MIDLIAVAFLIKYWYLVLLGVIFIIWLLFNIQYYVVKSATLKALKEYHSKDVENLPFNK